VCIPRIQVILRLSPKAVPRVENIGAFAAWRLHLGFEQVNLAFPNL
jgi:hypothetical protein